MKTGLKFSFLLFACVLLGSCCRVQNVRPIVHGDNFEYEKLNIYAEVNSSEIPIEIGEGYDIDLSGDVSSCNLANVSSLTIYGLIENPDSQGRFEIQEGEFDLYAETTGCTLSGSFTGNGFQDASNFEINASIAVSYGSGTFEADGGKLQMNITGKVPSENDEYIKYTLEIDGSLSKRLNSTVGNYLILKQRVGTFFSFHTQKAGGLSGCD